MSMAAAFHGAPCNDSSVAPVLSAGHLDVALVVDGTGSMGTYYPAVCAAVQEVVQRMEGMCQQLAADIQWAVVSYTDHPKGLTSAPANAAATIVCDFGDADTACAALYSIECKDGYDVCEDAVSGLLMAQYLAWRPGSTRAVVLVLDEPPHEVVHLNSAVGTHVEYLPRYDSYPTGSPTGVRIREALEALQAQPFQLACVFVVWCHEGEGLSSDSLRHEFEKACWQLVLPAPDLATAAAARVSPSGFFKLSSVDTEAVVEPICSAVCELCLTAVAIAADRLGEGTAAATDSVAKAVSLVTTTGGHVSVPTTNGGTRRVSVGTDPCIGELVARVTAHLLHSNFVSRSSAGRGVLAPASVQLVMSSESKGDVPTPVLLGAGNYGRVFAGTLIEPNGRATPVAIKAIGMPFVGDHPTPEGLVELEALLSLGGSGTAGLVRFHGWTRPSAQVSPHLGFLKPGSRWVLLVMHRYDLTLRDALASGRLTPRQLISVANQVAAGLFYLHNGDRVMQDLKPENVLLDTSSSTKIVAVIADLGMACRTDIEEGKTVGGTRGYIDPALVARRILNASPFTDMYSYGCVLDDLVAHMPDSEYRAFLVDMSSRVKGEHRDTAAQVMSRFRDRGWDN